MPETFLPKWVWFISAMLWVIQFFIRLEPFQANFLLWCSAKFACFCQLNVKVYREKASVEKGILRYAARYPTSSHFFKDFSPKIPGCLKHLQCLLLYSSPLSTKTKQNKTNSWPKKPLPLLPHYVFLFTKKYFVFYITLSTSLPYYSLYPLSH